MKTKRMALSESPVSINSQQSIVAPAPGAERNVAKESLLGLQAIVQVAVGPFGRNPAIL